MSQLKLAEYYPDLIVLRLKDPKIVAKQTSVKTKQAKENRVYRKNTQRRG